MNPISSALGKVGDYFSGKSVVDNAKDVGSAYSIKQRNIRSAATQQSSQSKALEDAMKKTQAKKGQTFGSPIK